MGLGGMLGILGHGEFCLVVLDLSRQNECLLGLPTGVLEDHVLTVFGKLQRGRAI